MTAAAVAVAQQPEQVLEKKTIVYDDRVVRWFIAASVGWGIVGMLVGAWAALQLAWFPANVTQYFAFGRIRPLHTNAVIFAFVGNMMFAGIYHSTQRLVKARLPSKFLSLFHFWGWQAIIVSAAITLPLGMTQAKEYAELEWPIDLGITFVWVAFAINFFWLLARRTEKHLYVAIWFYISTIVTVAVLHVINSLAMPVIGVMGLKSYSIFGGAQDALVQWWYGHNAVAFFLTTPILGIMYYYLPKVAERPVYSYRLSVIHFWSLIFVYIWAGPHHLLNTALPDWAQTLGMVFSVMLWAPSWGGMLNGLATLRGAWGKVRTEPVLKFFVAALTFYGMSTFEGPMLAVKSVSGLAHYTDWIIGHVHSGALGWNGFMAAGMFYYMVPRLWGRELHSKRLADIHFYVGTVGILLYVIAMWVSGITQGLMWRATDEGGGLTYPNFVETLIAIKPMYWMRLIGGSLYLLGMILMAYNLAKTALAGKPVETSVEVVVEKKPAHEVPLAEILFGRPVIVITVVGATVATMMVVNKEGSIFLACAAVIAAILGTIAMRAATAAHGGVSWHRLLEGRALYFTVFTGIAVLAGGVAEIIPSLVIDPIDKTAASEIHPYRPLELEGRDVFIKEGCYNCHSQMIRPFDFETKRYGKPSTLAESMYDHPFQWGSKRTGPDLAREGGKYPNVWHYKHLIDPRSVSEGSNMPPYDHLLTNAVDFAHTPNKMNAMRAIGVPYTDDDVDGAMDDIGQQANGIVDDLAAAGADADPNSEMVALIAFLQRLGTHAEPAPAKGPNVSINK